MIIEENNNYSSLELSEIDKSMAIEFVKYESMLRKSDFYQNLYNIHRNIIIEDLIQYDVLKHFKYKQNRKNLSTLRKMFDKYRYDNDVRENAFWIKNNIIKKGIDIGTDFIDIVIHKLDGEKINMSSLIKTPSNMFIVITGSLT